jgi:hypothetical protein
MASKSVLWSIIWCQCYKTLYTSSLERLAKDIHSGYARSLPKSRAQGTLKVPSRGAPLSDKLLALPPRISLGWKGLPKTDTLGG